MATKHREGVAAALKRWAFGGFRDEIGGADDRRRSVLASSYGVERERRKATTPRRSRRALRRALQDADEAQTQRIRDLRGEIQQELESWSAEIDGTWKDIASYLEDYEPVTCDRCDGAGCLVCNGDGEIRRHERMADRD